MKRNKSHIEIFLLIFLIVGTLIFGYYSKFFKFGADELNTGESQIANIINNGGDYTGSSIDNPQIPKYDKFELTFDVNWKDKSTGLDYNALASEWTQNTVHKANTSVKYNNKIYVAKGDVAKENNTASPDVASTLWTDLGKSYINPYWPYDPDPVANQSPAWDSSTSYKGNQRVTYNNTVYRAIHNLPVPFTNRTTTTYYKSSTPGKLGAVVYLDSDPNKKIYECIASDGANGFSNPATNPTYWKDLGYTFADTGPGGSHASDYWAANPPDPIPEKGIGITVNAQFLYQENGSQLPDWSNAVKASAAASIQSDQYIDQYGFFYKNYQQFQPNKIGDSVDNIVPIADQWKIRFAPAKEGTWYYRIITTDATGQTTYSTNSKLNCTSSQNHGFVQVSKNDTRYFETSDGQYLPLVGTENLTVYDPTANDGKGRQIGNATINSVNNYFGTLKDKMNVLRTWWNGGNGRLAVFGMSNNNGCNDVYWNSSAGCATMVPLKDHTDSSMPLSWSKDLFVFKMNNPAAGTYFDQPFPVKPNSTYQVSGWVKTENVTLDPSCTGNKCHKLFVQPGAISVADSNTFQGTSVDLTANNGSTDWTWLNGTFTTMNGSTSIPWLTIAPGGATGGSVLYNDISVKEVNSDGTLGLELMPLPNQNLYKYYNQYTSVVADAQVEAARANGVYLIVDLGAKEDGVWNSIAGDGTAVPIRFDGNFFGEPHSAGRGYLNYFWRYAAARWGYATSIHSFEIANETYTGNNMFQTNDMAKLFKNYDPNQHLVTASQDDKTLHDGVGANWSQINKADGLFPDVAYADFHASVGTQINPRTYNTPGWSVSSSSTSPWKVELNCGKDNGKCLHAHQSSQGTTSVSIYPSTLIPSHKYTLRWWNKKTADSIGTVSLITSAFYSRDSWLSSATKLLPINWSNYNNLTSNQSLNSTDGPLSGIDVSSVPPGSDWEQRGLQFIVPKCGTQSNCPANIWSYFDGNTPSLPDSPYIPITVKANNFSGDMYFDDFTIYDETAGKPAELLNGNFEENTITEDMAMSTYNWGYTMGKPNQNPTQRVINAPIVNTNVLIWNNNNDGKNPKGYDQNIIDTKDQSYSWYKKFLWGQTHSDSIIGFWYDFTWITDQVSVTQKALPLGQPYLKFMKGISLNNGKYQDAAAETSDTKLRAWGQKEIIDGKADRAHLWIDNKPYNWQNIIKSQAGTAQLASPISGTVTVPNMKENQAFKIEWWNTEEADPAKQIMSNTTATSDASGNLVIPVSNLVSDVALKIEVTTITALSNPSISAPPNPITYKTSYKVSGTKTASVTNVLVNGTGATVDNTNNTWESTITLALGDNTITVVGKDDKGNQTDPTVIQLNRRKGGDANGDGKINIFDFSSLMLNWGKGKSYLADFNEDGSVDIKDFSVVMSGWGK